LEKVERNQQASARLCLQSDRSCRAYNDALRQKLSARRAELDLLIASATNNTRKALQSDVAYVQALLLFRAFRLRHDEASQQILAQFHSAEEARIVRVAALMKQYLSLDSKVSARHSASIAAVSGMLDNVSPAH